MHSSTNKLDSAVKQYIIRPNCSMSWSVTVKLIAIIAIVMLLIAIGFISLGLWLVVPFLGLELIFVISVFYIVSCNAKRVETIEISQYKIKIQQHRPLVNKARAIQTFELDKIWAQVLLKQARYRNHEDKLFIFSHGVQLEVASVLNSEERKRFAIELQHAVQADMSSSIV